MAVRAVSELLSLPVRTNGIQLGTPVDALLDVHTDRLLGFEVLRAAPRAGAAQRRRPAGGCLMPLPAGEHLRVSPPLDVRRAERQLHAAGRALLRRLARRVRREPDLARSVPRLAGLGEARL